MRRMKRFTAAFLSAGLMLCPVCAHAEFAAQEAETFAEEGQEEEKGGWLAGLNSFLDDNGQALSDLLGKADNAVSGAVSGIVSSLGGIGDLLGGLGSLLGGDDVDLLEVMLGQSQAIRTAGVNYILEYNASLMEPGDVQIVADGAVSDNPEENGIAYTLCCFIQQNFTEDENHVLHFLCEKQDVVLLTLEKQEDGSFVVADAAFAEEGDDYEATLEGFLPYVYSDSVQECLEDIDFSAVYTLPDTLAAYLDSHPETAGIEFEGKIMTAEELRTVRDERMYEYIDLLYGTEEEETSEPESRQ